MRLPLKTQNLLLILAGVFVIAVGYLLMSTEKFVDATSFSLSLHVCPILIVIGHFVVVAGILMRFDKKSDQPSA